VRPAGALLLGFLLAVPAAAEVTVRVTPVPGGAAPHVELTARAAPLTEVLDRLGRQIGMKVVYEGASPRQLVTVSLQGRSTIETVLGLLDGQGVNFALLSDPTGTRAETLLVAGTAPATASSGTSAPGARPTPTPAFRRPLGPPPGSSPDTIEEPEDAEDEQPLEQPAAGAPGNADAAPAGAQPDPAATNPVPVPQAPGSASSSFPVSPFAPQASPVTTQPFPPLPPGVPGGPTSTSPATQQPDQPTSPPPGA
jgi:hypothetical protein